MAVTPYGLDTRYSRQTHQGTGRLEPLGGPCRQYSCIRCADAVRPADELSEPNGPLRQVSRELPEGPTVALRDYFTQALSKRSPPRSVSVAATVAYLHASLYPPLLRVSATVSSKGGAWPVAHAAANTSSPSARQAAATIRSCSARLTGGSGQPLSSRSAAAAPRSRATRSHPTFTA